MIRVQSILTVRGILAVHCVQLFHEPTRILYELLVRLVQLRALPFVQTDLLEQAWRARLLIVQDWFLCGGRGRFCFNHCWKGLDLVSDV